MALLAFLQLVYLYVLAAVVLAAEALCPATAAVTVATDEEEGLRLGKRRYRDEIRM